MSGCDGLEMWAELDVDDDLNGRYDEATEYALSWFNFAFLQPVRLSTTISVIGTTSTVRRRPEIMKDEQTKGVQIDLSTKLPRDANSSHRVDSILLVGKTED